MTQKPDLALASKLKTAETHIRRYASLLAAAGKKYAQLLSKYKEKERENQRLAMRIAELKRELKKAQEQSVWSDE